MALASTTCARGGDGLVVGLAGRGLDLTFAGLCSGTRIVLTNSLTFVDVPITYRPRKMNIAPWIASEINRELLPNLFPLFIMAISPPHAHYTTMKRQKQVIFPRGIIHSHGAMTICLRSRYSPAPMAQKRTSDAHVKRLHGSRRGSPPEVIKLVLRTCLRSEVWRRGL